MWGEHDILAVAVASSRMSGAREPVTVTVNWHPSKVARGREKREGGKGNGNGGQLAQARKRFALLFAFQSNKAKRICVNWQITHKQRDAQQQQQLQGNCWHLTPPPPFPTPFLLLPHPFATCCHGRKLMFAPTDQRGDVRRSNKALRTKSTNQFSQAIDAWPPQRSRSHSTGQASAEIGRALIMSRIAKTNWRAEEKRKEIAKFKVKKR